MSIEKDYDIYIAVCDICGDDIGPFEDFYDAVDAKKSRWLAFTQRRAFGGVI